MITTSTDINELLSIVQQEDLDNVTFVEKEADGRYRIVAVSTAALPDREGETFTTKAIDFDIANAIITKEYPEFRLFHSKGLGIGRVEKMSRVGIFAVDEGHSYDDPFSLAVCNELLSNNENGKWKVSRGFRVLKVAGGCPHCNEQLVVERKHMLGLGFKCPTCKSHHTGYKGLLKDVRFLETKTFDVTITDVPAVPYTGVGAFREIPNGDLIMTKEQLKERLLEAGLAEDVVDERLNSLSNDTLKEFDDVPEAYVSAVFKEKTEKMPAGDEDEDVEEEEYDDEEKEYFTLDPSVLDAFRDITYDVMKEVMATAELEVGDDLEIEVKESPILAQLVETVNELKEQVAALTRKDEQRLKEKMRNVPRNGKLRILRHKEEDVSTHPDADEDEEDESMQKQYPFERAKQAAGGTIVDSDGNQYKSLTEMITS